MTTNTLLPSSDIWVVRAERGGIYANYFLINGLVTIGWGEVGPILSSDSNEDIIQRCLEAYPWDNNGGHRVRRFVREIAVGDAVATYDNNNRVYHVGIIRSAAEHGTQAHCGEFPGYSRAVEWVGQVSRDALSLDARNRLGSLLTIFRVRTSTSQEIRQLCTGGTEADATQNELLAGLVNSDDDDVLDTDDILEEYLTKSDQFVEDAIAKLGPYQLQDLVAGILRTMGYKTRVSPPGPDRGVDIAASPDGLGLSEPRIFVQVKHRTGAIGAPDVSSFLGRRHSGDRCLYVSTGGFSNEARSLAANSSIPLTLITMPELRDLVVINYESLDSETRSLVPLKKVYWPVSV
jgi:restriction system protein